MNVSLAKRRLLRWHRYIRATNSVGTNRLSGGYHRGHAKANWGYMTAGRATPNGLRVPLTPWAQKGGA